uniref:Putative replicase n=1 Tax=Jaksystermes virus TaxID=2796597 RepID=A0A7T7K9G7_9VIRU|nr:putative replicase [Jaksystermes virus]
MSSNIAQVGYVPSSTPVVSKVSNVDKVSLARSFKNSLFNYNWRTNRPIQRGPVEQQTQKSAQRHEQSSDATVSPATHAQFVSRGRVVHVSVPEVEKVPTPFLSEFETEAPKRPLTYDPQWVEACGASIPRQEPEKIVIKTLRQSDRPIPADWLEPSQSPPPTIPPPLPPVQFKCEVSKVASNVTAVTLLPSVQMERKAREVMSREGWTYVKKVAAKAATVTARAIFQATTTIIDRDFDATPMKPGVKVATSEKQRKQKAVIEEPLAKKYPTIHLMDQKHLHDVDCELSYPLLTHPERIQYWKDMSSQLSENLAFEEIDSVHIKELQHKIRSVITTMKVRREKNFAYILTPQTTTEEIADIVNRSPYPKEWVMRPWIEERKRLFAELPHYPDSDLKTIVSHGCFDNFHQGHYNQLRQCAEAYDRTFVIAYIPSDKCIKKHKNKVCVDSLEERIAKVSACEFVDLVVAGEEWEVTEKLLDTLGADKVAYESPLPGIPFTRMLITKRTPNISTSQMIADALNGVGDPEFVAKVQAQQEQFQKDTKNRLEAGTSPELLKLTEQQGPKPIDSSWYNELIKQKNLLRDAEMECRRQEKIKLGKAVEEELNKAEEARIKQFLTILYQVGKETFSPETNKEQVQPEIPIANVQVVAEEQLTSAAIMTAQSAADAMSFDFWGIIFKNWYTICTWTVFWMVFGWVVSPTLATTAMVSTLCTATFKSFSRSISRTINATVTPAVSNMVQTSVDKVVDGLERYTKIVSTEGISLKNLCTAINNHKIGIGANIMLIMNSKDITTVTYALMSTFSMLGFEQSLINTFIAKISTAALGITSINREQVGLDEVTEMASDFIGRHKTSFTMQRSMSILAMLCVAFGVNVNGSNPLKWVNEANNTRKSIEEVVGAVEEQLNLLGFIQTGKHAYMKELENQTESIRKEFEVINNQMSAAPAYFISPTGWRTWQKFKAEVMRLERIMVKNQCPDLKNSRLFIHYQIIIQKVYAWEAQLQQIRGVCGKRVEPVGVCIVGPSQIGKSKLRSEIAKRVAKKLEERSNEYPSFANATEWTTWNVQARDEYDQGYNGQEITYMDDGFADKEHKDHAMWLTFISGESVGTVQANLQEKGMPYASRLCMVSCNNLPVASSKINNIEALHRRFPYTIACQLKPRVDRPGENAAYDPDFKHLHFHVGSMHTHCGIPNNNQQCTFTQGGVPNPQCKATMQSLDELVDNIVQSMINREEKFQTELRAFTGIELNQQPQPNQEQVGLDIPSPRPSAELNGNRGVQEVLLDAFKRPKLVTIADMELVPILNLLKHTHTNLPARTYCLENHITTVYDFLIQIVNFSLVDETQARVFAELWVRLFGAGRRVCDVRLETDYVYSCRLNGGTAMYAVPTVDGVINRWDPSIPEHEMILNLCREARVVVYQQEGGNLVHFQMTGWGTTIQDPSLREIYVSSRWWYLGALITAQFVYTGLIPGFILEGYLALYGTHLLQLLHYSITHIPRFVNIEQSWFARQAQQATSPIARISSSFCVSFMYYWNKGADIVRDAWEYVWGWVKSLRHQFAWIFYKLGEFLGLTFDQTYEQWATIIADKLAMATVTIAAGAIIGLGYALYSYLFSSSSEPSQTQAYDHVVRSSARKQRKLERVTAHRQLCPEFRQTATHYQEQMKHEDFYNNGKPCPFCDEKIYGQQPTRDLGAYMQKVNKDPVYDYDNIVFPKKHSTECGMLNGNYDEEFQATCEAAEEEGLEWFGFQKNFGSSSGGSVPHTHTKYYRHQDGDCPWWTPSERFKKFINEHGWALDIYSVRSPGNKRAIIIPFTCQYDFQVFGQLVKLLQPLWRQSSCSSWTLDGYVNDQWICGSFTLLTSSISGSERGWTPSELKSLAPLIREILNREISNIDLVDPTFVYTEEKFEDAVLTTVSSNVKFPQVRTLPYNEQDRKRFEASVMQIAGESLIVCTGNEQKQREFAQLLPHIQLEFHSFSWDEIQGDSWEIACNKVKAAYNHFKRPVLIDDSSLSFAALNGMPGPYIKDFILKMGAKGIADMIAKLGDNKASARSIIAVYNGIGEPKIFESKVDGYIIPPTHELTRENWDSIFSPDGKQTFAELPLSVKPRAGAISGMVESTVFVELGCQEPSKQQSADDAALDLCRILETRIGVIVQRAFEGGQPKDEHAWEILDQYRYGAWCSGLAIGSQVLCPGHVGVEGSWYKVYPMEGLEPTKTKKWNLKPYAFAQLVRHDTVKDIGVLQLYSNPEAKRRLTSQRGSPVHIPTAIGPCNYAYILANHLMTEEAWLQASKGVACVQYVPTEGMLCPGYASYTGTRQLMIERNGEVVTEEKDVIVVQGIQTDINTTQNGDCGGLLIAMNSHLPRKVLGFHVLGTSYDSKSVILHKGVLDTLLVQSAQISDTNVIINSHPTLTAEAGQGNKQLKDWPEVEWAPPALQCHDCIKPGFPTDLPKGDDVIPIGVLTYPHMPAPVRSPPEELIGNSTSVPQIEAWMPSPFHKAFEIQSVPSALNPSDERIEVDLPRNALGRKSLLLEPNSVMGEVLPEPDTDILSQVYEDLMREWEALFANDNLAVPDQPEEALEYGLNGVPNGQFVGGMNLQASCGIPWNEVPANAMKSNFINVDSEGKRSFNLDNKGGVKLKAACILKLVCAQRGLRTKSFSASKLKDCLVKPDHVKIGKTRVFNCSSVEDVIVGNALFGTFKEAYMAKAKELNHGIGINVHSAQWRAIYDDLNELPNWFDVDYKNFDKHLPSVFLRLGFQMMIKIIEKSKDSWTLARYVLAESWVNSLMVDFQTVYMTEHSNKSGDVLTTVINSVVNQMFMIYCFYKTVKRDFALMRESIRFRTFGDDIVITVSDEVKGKFNFVTVQKCLASIGQIATPAKKCIDAPEFTPKEEITFLKRRFELRDGIVIGPLAKSSIESVFGWTRIPAADVTIWGELLKSHADEAVLHGKEYYEYYCKRLMGSAITCKNKVLKMLAISILARSYETVWQQYKDKLVGFEDQVNKEQMWGMIAADLATSGLQAMSKKHKGFSGAAKSASFGMNALTRPFTAAAEGVSKGFNAMTNAAKSMTTKDKNNPTTTARKAHKTTDRAGAFITRSVPNTSLSLKGVTTGESSTDKSSGKTKAKAMKIGKSVVGTVGSGVVGAVIKFGVDKILTQATAGGAKAKPYFTPKSMGRTHAPNVEQMEVECDPDEILVTRSPQQIQSMHVQGRLFDDVSIPNITIGLSDFTELAGCAFESEVGPPTEIPWVGGSKIPGFVLRPSYRKEFIHRPLATEFGDLFHYPLITPFSIPLDSTPLVFEPYMSQTFLSMFQQSSTPWWGFSYDYVYIFRLDEPLGSSHVIEIDVASQRKTLTATTNRRKIIWTTRDYPAVAVFVGWMGPRFVIPQLSPGSITPRTGMVFEPMSVRFTVVHKNVSDSVVEPLNAICWQMPVNISSLGMKMAATWAEVWTPVEPNSQLMSPFAQPITHEVAFINKEESAPDTEDPINTTDITTSLIQPVLEEPAIGAQSSLPGASNVATAWTNPRWWGLGTVDISGVGPILNGTRQVWDVNPIRLPNQDAGESMSKPFLKWEMCTGTWKNGHLMGFELMIISARNPHTSGVIMVYSCAYPDGVPSGVTHTQCAQRSYHVLGGAPSVHDLEIPQAVYMTDGVLDSHALVSGPGLGINYVAGYNQALLPWFEIRAFSMCWAMTVLSLNSSDTSASIHQTITMYIRPTYMNFRIPRKTHLFNPNGRKLEEKEEVTFTDLAQAFTNLAINHEQSSDDAPIVPVGIDQTTYLATGGHDDVSPNDEFWVRLLDDTFYVDTYENSINPAAWSTLVRIRINPFAMPERIGNYATNWTNFREKADRYSICVPTGEGLWGPYYGMYKIILRMPVSIGCNVIHFAIPPEHNEISDGILTGTSHMLSYSGAKMFSVGANAPSAQMQDSGLILTPSLVGTGGSEDGLPADMGVLPVSKYLGYMDCQLYTDNNPLSGVYQYVGTDLFVQLTDFYAQIGYSSLPEEQASEMTIPYSLFINMSHARWMWQRYETIGVIRSISPYRPHAGHVSTKALLEATAFHFQVGSRDQGMKLAAICAKLLKDGKTSFSYNHSKELYSGPPATPDELKEIYKRAIDASR